MEGDDNDRNSSFGMSNLFFGDVDDIDLSNPPSGNPMRPANHLTLRSVQEDSVASDGDGDWGVDGDDEEELPVQTSWGIYSRAKKRDKSPTNRKVAPKRQRVEGGRAAIAKKVTADLDSEDEIIVTMKQQNWSDRDVAYHLIAQGRINYDRKTIATRWARLRKALAEREDQLLDDELTDWHEGEDEALVKSYRRAENQIEHELQKARDKLWRYTADLLRHERPTSKYSPRACQERYEALLKGTARIPPELDDNPEQRRQEREEKLATRRREKEVEMKAQEEEEIRQQQLREANEKARQDEILARKLKKEEAAEEKKRKAEEAARAKELLREEQTRAKEQARLIEARTRAQKKAKTTREARKKAEAIEKVRAEKAARAAEKAQRENNLRKLKEEQAKAKLDALQKAQEVKRARAAIKEPQVSAFTNDFSSSLRDIQGNKDDSELSGPEDGLDEEQERPAEEGAEGAGLSTSENRPQSTRSLGLDSVSPRRHMSNQDLYALLQKRGIKGRTGMNKQAMLVALNHADFQLSTAYLRKDLRSRGLKISGVKSELIYRIACDDDAKSKKASASNRSAKPPFGTNSSAQLAGALAGATNAHDASPEL
ncbi:MAG: hypothetical protein M1820_007179 [Bogoriella megaspora]|nr:MAG: hypothetical protein M1820_007179 [Bogoriella megaspora]